MTDLKIKLLHPTNAKNPIKLVRLIKLQIVKNTPY